MGGGRRLFSLSFKNLKCHRWLNVKIIIALTCLMFLICMFCFFPITLCTSLNDYNTKEISGNYIKSGEEIDGLLTVKYKKTQYSETVLKNINYGIELIISLDGEMHACKINRALPFSFYSGEIFTENDYKALKSAYGYTNFIYGKMPENNDEILLSEVLLDNFGLTKDDALNREIVFINLFKQPETGTAKVSGVIRREYYGLSGHDSFSVYPNVYMTDNSSLGLSGGTANYIYSFEEFPSAAVSDDWKDRGIYDLYYAKGTLSSIEFVRQLQDICVQLFSVFGVLICVGALFTVYLLMNKYTKYFSRSGGIFSVCGADKKTVNLIMYIQLLFFCLVAAVVAVAAILVGYVLLGDALGFYLSGDVMKVNARFLFILLGIGFGAVLAVSSLIYALNLVAARKQTVKEMLEMKVD